MTTDRKSGRLVFLARWLLIIVLALLAIFAIFVVTFDLNQYKGQIENGAGRALGRPLELRGDISMGLSLLPTVVANDLRIANPEWSDVNDFAVINRLVFRIDLLALLLDEQLKADAVVLEGVQLNLEKNQAGEDNWTFEGEQADGQSSGLSAIQEVVIRNAIISYRMADGQLEVLQVKDALTSTDDGLLSLEMDAAYRDEVFSARLQRQQPVAQKSASPSLSYALEIAYRGFEFSTDAVLDEGARQLRLANVQLHAADKVDIPLDIKTGSLQWSDDAGTQFSLAGQYGAAPVQLDVIAGTFTTWNSDEAFPLTIDMIMDEDLLHLQSTLSGEVTQPVINIVSASFKDSHIKGKLAIDTDKYPLAISGQLESSKLAINDVEHISALMAELTDSKQDASTSLPGNVELDLNIRINDLADMPVGITAMRGDVMLSQGELRVSNLKMMTPSGEKNGTATIKPAGNGLGYSLQLNSKKLDARKLLRGHKISGKSVSGMMKTIELDMQGPVVPADKLLSQSRIRLKAGKSELVLHGADKRHSQSLQLDSLAFVSEPEKSVTLDIKGQSHGSTFGINLTTASMAKLKQASTSSPIELTASFAGHRLHAEGSMSEMQVGKGLHVSLNIKGDSLQTLEPLFEVDLPQTGSYELSGRLDATEDEYKISDIKGKIGKSDVMGKMQVSTAKQRPAITADLSSKALHSDDLFTHEGRQGDGRLIPDFQIPVELLNSFNSIIDIKAEKFYLGEVEYQDLIFHANLKDGLLKLEPFDSRLSGALVDGALHVDTRQKKPTTLFSMNSKDTDYGGLLESFGWTDKMEGLGDVEINLQGSGTTLRESLANSTGYIQLVAGEGTIKHPNFDLWAAGLVTSALSNAWKTKEAASVQCIVGRFDIKDGMVTSDTLMLDTTEITVAGTASIDLKSEIIDAVIQPAPKNPSFISMANPVKLSGSLLSPEVSVEQTLGRRWGLRGLLLGLANPATLLVMYSDLGTGVQNPCYEAVVKREAKEAEAEKDGSSDSLELPDGNILKKLLPGD